MCRISTVPMVVSWLSLCVAMWGDVSKNRFFVPTFPDLRTVGILLKLGPEA